MADNAISDFLDYIERNAPRLDFFGVLATLEGLFPSRGGDPFTTGAIRFGLDTSFAFPPGDIASIKRDNGGITITPKFMGLANATSPLPHYFVEYAGRVDAIRKRIEKGGSIDNEDLGVLAFVDLLTIFNCRIYVLFYNAWKKYAPLRSLTAHSSLARCIASLAGRQNDDSGGPSLFAYAGLFAGTPRGAGGLQTLLSDYFGGIPVRVLEFTPRRVELADPPILGKTARLGVTAVCGTSVSDQSGAFRVTVGPVNRTVFEKFLSGGEYYSTATVLIETYLTEPLDYDFQIIMSKSNFRTADLGSENVRLGINAVLGDTAKDDGNYAIIVEGGRHPAGK